MPRYESSLQNDLDRLRSKLTEMAGRADRSLRDGIVALMSNHRQLAYSIILRDTFIDALDREIDRREPRAISQEHAEPRRSDLLFLNEETHDGVEGNASMSQRNRGHCNTASG